MESQQSQPRRATIRNPHFSTIYLVITKIVRKVADQEDVSGVARSRRKIWRPLDKAVLIMAVIAAAFVDEVVAAEECGVVVGLAGMDSLAFAEVEVEAIVVAEVTLPLLRSSVLSTTHGSDLGGLNGVKIPSGIAFRKIW